MEEIKPIDSQIKEFGQQWLRTMDDEVMKSMGVPEDQLYLGDNYPVFRPEIRFGIKERQVKT